MELAQKGEFLVKFALSSIMPIYLLLFSFLLLFGDLVAKVIIKIDGRKVVHLLFWCSCLLLVCLASLLAVFISSNFYIDPIISPSIASISAIFAKGGEVYPSPQSGNIYGLLYGPIVYIVNGFFLFIFGPSILVSKFASLFAALGSFIILYLLLQRQVIKKETTYFLGLYAGLLLILVTSFPLEVRSDPLLLFLVALSLLAGIGFGFKSGVFVVALAIGLAFNLKVTGVFYFLPAVYALIERFSWRTLLLLLPLGFLVAAAPFFLFSSINISHYFHYLGIASTHMLDIGGFVNNVSYVGFVSLPFLFFAMYNKNWNGETKRIIRLCSYAIISGLLISFFASKTGSGASHLVPLFPAFIYIYVLMFKKLKDEGVLHNVLTEKSFLLISLPFVITIIFVSLVNTLRMFRLYNVYPIESVGEVKSLIAKYQHVQISMGYSNVGADARLSTNIPALRPLIVFAKNEYLLDLPSLADLKEGGQEVSKVFIDNVRNCKTGSVWFFPKGGKPFEGVTGYGKVLISDEVKSAFYTSHKFRESNKYIDVWMCD